MYEEKNFESLIGMQGLSEDLLKAHFGLYAGYVANTNTLAEKLQSTEHGTPEYAELKRRFGWEFNGMRLHELYFGNMSKDPKALSDGALKEKITKAFGSAEKWHEDFVATGKMRGIGWVILAHDQENDSLFNVWINEHDVGHLAGAQPLLVMDVFEHAYVMDYAMDRGAYIDAFMAAIDWSVVEARLA